MPDITMSTCYQHGVAHVEPPVGRISVVRTTARACVCAWRWNNRHIFGCDRDEPAFAYSFESNGYAVRQLGQTDDVGPDWLDRVIGSMKDEPAFDKVLDYGRAIRQADRPAEDQAT